MLALESRFAKEMATLISKQGGDAFVAPSMREVPLERNEEAFRFAERLFAKEFDCLVFLTGVGTRFLDKLLAQKYGPARFTEALKTLTVIARGPKPMAVLRQLGLPTAILVPEPNTWRETLAVMQARPERQIAVQEYGRSSTELLAGLQQMGCTVSAVPVYQWDLPENTAPLREAVRRLAARQFDAALFTTSIQVQHLLQVAGEENLEAQVRASFREIVVGSIGPATSEALREAGLPVSFEPAHPKMGVLVAEFAQFCSRRPVSA